MNSLCIGTGNQFDHNRAFNSRQQGINSTQQGIGAKSISLDGSNDSITCQPAKAAFADMTLTFLSHPILNNSRD